MGRRSFPGGIISGAEPSVSGSGASGMWTLQTSAQKKTANSWPIRGVVPIPASVGPTISNVAVTDSSYNVLNDTPYVSSTGGYIKITGTGFASGAVVYVGGSAAVSTSFISSTEVRAQIGAGSSNTFPVYIVNSDNSTGIKLSAITYSGTPTWSTSATLTDQSADSPFSIALSATSDSSITYTVDTGSTLPPGTTLYTNGVFAGTVTGLSVDTAYSFAVLANDAENQDSSRTFTVTVVLGDPYFYLTPLLLKGDAGSSTWITDSSTNKFSITVSGDAKSSAFSPYATYWSGYFDGTGDYITIGNTSLLTFGTSAYTIEFWFFGEPSIADYKGITGNGTFSLYFNTSSIQLWNGASPVFQPTMSPTVPRSRWTFIQIIRTSTASNGLAFYVDGTLAATGTDSTNWTATGTTYFFTEGSRPTSGFVTDLRISSVARTAGVPTAPLTSDANTRVLTLQNRRFIDNSSNALTITPSGDAGTRSFTPWTENTTTVGSGYFDGTGDYLTVASNTAFTFPGDFTIEAWVNSGSSASVGGAYPTIFATSAFNSTGIGIKIQTSGGAGAAGVACVWNNSTQILTGTTVVATNAWHHIAVSRVGTSMKLFVNGLAEQTITNSTTFTAAAGYPLIGADTTSTGTITGYVADLRVVKGIGVYTGNFTPVTSSLSSTQSSSTNVAAITDTSTSLLTLQYRQSENNHRFVDDSPVKALITRGGNPNLSSFTPLGKQGWSVSFDGSGDYISVATNTAFALGTGDFTVECWVNMSVTTGTYVPFMQSSSSTVSATNVIWFFAITGGNLVFNTHASGGFTATTPWAPVAGRWYHIAAVRQSGTMRLFIDGVAGTVSTTGTPSGYSLSEAGMAVGMIATPYYLTGFISNARVVKGFALYTASFTPLATSLSVVSGTVLLTAQSATNGFDITGQGLSISLLGDAKVQSFSPFSRYTANVYNAAYSPTLHGGSAYFDGSGDYLYMVQTNATYLATNNHTVEFWMYPDGTQTQYSVLWYYSVGAGTGSSNTYYFSIGSNSPADMTLLMGPLSGTWALQITIGNAEYVKILNTWTHVVITRSGTAFRIFLNGILRAYGTTAQSIAAQGGVFSLGWDGVNATTSYKGWLSNFRVINGSIPTAYQTATTTTGTSVFSIPTEVPAIEANTVMQLSFTNAGIYDSAGRVTLETLGDVKVSNVQSKFGTGALSFDGTGDYIKGQVVPHYTFGTGDFTFECWIYMNSYNATWGSQIFGGHTYGVAADYIWMVNTTGKIYFQITSSTTGAITSTSSVPLTTWTHIALVRASGTVTPYINGTSAGGAASYTTAMTISITPTIGGDSSGNAGAFLNGYIDDFRITKYARTITVPSSGFAAK
jgi:hypothetical protein